MSLGYAVNEVDAIVQDRESNLGYLNINPSRLALHIITVARDNKIVKNDFVSKANNMKINVEGIDIPTDGVGKFYNSMEIDSEHYNSTQVILCSILLSKKEAEFKKDQTKELLNIMTASGNRNKLQLKEFEAVLKMMFTISIDYCIEFSKNFQALGIGVSLLEQYKKDLDSKSEAVQQGITSHLFSNQKTVDRSILEYHFNNSEIWGKLLTASGIRELCTMSADAFEDLHQPARI